MKPPTDAQTSRPARGHAGRVAVAPLVLGRLDGADYADAFCITSRTRYTAKQWACSMFEGGPAVPRRIFSTIAWQGVLGLRLAPADTPGHVAGWAIIENEPEIIVLHAVSRLMVARMVVDVSDSHTTFTTMLRYEHAAARHVWAVAGHLHRALSPQVLERADHALTRSAAFS